MHVKTSKQGDIDSKVKYEHCLEHHTFFAKENDRGGTHHKKECIYSTKNIRNRMRKNIYIQRIDAPNTSRFITHRKCDLLKRKKGSEVTSRPIGLMELRRPTWHTDQIGQYSSSRCFNMGLRNTNPPRRLEEGNQEPEPLVQSAISSPSHYAHHQWWPTDHRRVFACRHLIQSSTVFHL